jgi:hypothetical protein
MLDRLPIAYLQIICRLLNKFLKIGDLERVVFDFYMLRDLDVSPETATVLETSGRFVGQLGTVPVLIQITTVFTVTSILQITVDTFFLRISADSNVKKRNRSWRFKVNQQVSVYTLLR